MAFFGKHRLALDKSIWVMNRFVPEQSRPPSPIKEII
jgi:hypothetical protein